MLLPAVILFAGLYAAGKFALIQPELFSPGPPWPSLLFIAAAITGVAGPILIRTLFANSVTGKKRATVEAFTSFQKRLTGLACLTPYIAFAAMVCNLPKFYSSAIFLMTLYALYYHFPSARRIDFDRKIFRVTP